MFGRRHPIRLLSFLPLALRAVGCAEAPDMDADQPTTAPDDPLPVERPELREGEELPPEQIAFWDALAGHCGNARPCYSPPPGTTVRT